MIVKLTYFKPNGKFYSDGEYLTNLKSLYEIFAEVQKLREEKRLPGLVRGHSEFLVLIDVPAHPHNHPHLVV